MKNILIILFFVFLTQLTFAHKQKWDEDKGEWSPLMMAIYKGKTNKFLKLIMQNVDVNYLTQDNEDEYKLTALDVAIRVDNEKAIEALIKTNKILRLNESLMTASGYNRLLTIELLIKYGANPNYSSRHGHSVLMTATSFGSNEVIECLIKNGANINHSNNYGMTALMLAGYGTKIEKIKLLLKLGADKNMKNSKDLTALDYFNNYYYFRQVSENVKTEIIELLKL